MYRNVVTDMHGVFPEELRYYGKHAGAFLYRQIERIVVFNSRAIVAVTEAMARYFREKCGDRFRVYVIPIFDEIRPAREPAGLGPARPTVVYAGGAQKWQNIEAMMDAMRKARDRFDFVILTADIPVFKRLLTAYGLENQVTLRTVPKNEVYAYYARADLGFILRDDDIVNRAACPTKLVEYLQCGVVPIVLQPEIGDFAANGYACLAVDRLVGGDVPSWDELESMRNTNYLVMERIRHAAHAAMNELRADLAA
jgi:glycosyltransferase involved in cell wall biosynthesis